MDCAHDQNPLSWIVCVRPGCSSFVTDCKHDQNTSTWRACAFPGCQHFPIICGHDQDPAKFPPQDAREASGSAHGSIIRRTTPPIANDGTKPRPKRARDADRSDRKSKSTVRRRKKPLRVSQEESDTAIAYLESTRGRQVLETIGSAVENQSDDDVADESFTHM